MKDNKINYARPAIRYTNTCWYLTRMKTLRDKIMQVKQHFYDKYKAEMPVGESRMLPW